MCGLEHESGAALANMEENSFSIPAGGRAYHFQFLSSYIELSVCHLGLRIGT